MNEIKLSEMIALLQEKAEREELSVFERNLYTLCTKLQRDLSPDTCIHCPLSIKKS